MLESAVPENLRKLGTVEWDITMENAGSRRFVSHTGLQRKDKNQLANRATDRHLELSVFGYSVMPG